ncbi:aminomethyl-transferring glycine dehydrogenase subunit GcvPA [Estrella lausannensis]|uniref:Probable glycine dehydrogenase (decarboxylating) subunit 1 n=1 Tax=Estrella lausannensis TaxID=483423 RepID=A0A0H5E337_9BACT|nr:aminomethyl-transferring glycine dehydrogenase subunit GcvPA [Estrella lausannensis]CRX37600.1 Glycine dehydrogenase (decarboxylating) subunit 1 [Estrella lausannensis]
MDFVANSPVQRKEMMETIGIQDILELYRDIPSSLRLKDEFSEGLSEFEGLALMEKIASENKVLDLVSYLGGGAYEHHIPACVKALIRRGEFLTSYTPYQAEASQGMLQAIFEFQSMVAALTGLNISNASVYDGGSALAEAALMALRQQKERNTLVVFESVHPAYREIIRQYTESIGYKIETVPYNPKSWKTDFSHLEKALNKDTAALIIQSPNIFGRFEDTKQAFSKAKSTGALAILSSNPITFGAFQSAKEQGADIAAGELQPLGIPLQFGGPYAGYLACREELMRQMPGRIVGETVDTEGKTGYVLTLQAREQHIRREKATSNICTNQTLMALSSLMTALWFGPKGMKELALMNYQKAAYLKLRLAKELPGSVIEDNDFFNEFPVKFSKPIQEVLQGFRRAGIEPGIPLGKLMPKEENTLLVAVTEIKSKEMLDRYVETASAIEGRRD